MSPVGRGLETNGLNTKRSIEDLRIHDTWCPHKWRCCIFRFIHTCKL